MIRVKSQFPIFERKINDKPLVFLDSAASAQKPHCVIDAMNDVMMAHYANVNRGIYTLSQESTELVERSRSKVASFIGAQSDEIVFTKNATESINLVAYSWGRFHLTPSDVVVISEMEHHANIVPWQLLQKEIGFELYWIPVTNEGYLDMEKAKLELADKRVALVSVTHVSNVLGTINPAKEIISWAHSIGSKVLLDGAQAVTNLSVNVADLDCDWYVFSGHKLYGPTGMGFLYGKNDLLNSMPPFLSGGDMIVEVHKDTATFKQAPHRFEAGTPAIVEIVGLGAAIDFVTEIGIENIQLHIHELLSYAYPKIKAVPGVTIYGPSDLHDRAGVISFSMQGIHPHDIGTILDEAGIAIRTGHHCAQVICDRYGQSALARISFGVYNEIQDIDALLKGLEVVAKTFA